MLSPFHTLKKCLFVFLLFFLALEGTLPEINEKKVIQKTGEILDAHASYKRLTPELIARTLKNYLGLLDGNKIYLLESEVKEWVDASPETLDAILRAYRRGDFSTFFKIHEKLIGGIGRRNRIEEAIDYAQLPTDVKTDEFKDVPWAKTEGELTSRLMRLRALQKSAASKLPEEMGERSELWIAKYRRQYEEKMSNPDPDHQKRLILSNVLKAVTSALDSHTSYFTPGEARQFMINVQQRLFGIGVQLRDDLNGLTVTKILEGGPAEASGTLKVNDRIIAVDGVPIVGLDIVHAVEKIRGVENTPVHLTLIREEAEGEPVRYEITIVRGEVVIKEGRFESSTYPFADGVIGYLKLHSFYQDPDSSSTSDLANALQTLKKEDRVKGVILDLRFNPGGVLSQAVGVTGLFITKGVVVGIKNHLGKIQYLRDTGGAQFWDGPMIVLVNKSSASSSEIVAQALQDYGRALIVGDEHTYGKGSFQTFTLNTANNGGVNPEGEYKVTRGRYYTVSGKTPQLTGIRSDIFVPGPIAFEEMGEKFSDYPLESDSIKSNYNDSLADIPFAQRNQMRLGYKFGLQQQLDRYQALLPRLRKNSKERIESNPFYQEYLDALKNREHHELFEKKQPDYQLIETIAIMKDLVVLSGQRGGSEP